MIGVALKNPILITKQDLVWQTTYRDYYVIFKIRSYFQIYYHK